MEEIEESVCSMDFLPAEMVQSIFIYLPAKDLIRSRAVSNKWKLLIDDLRNKHKLWLSKCKEDFPSVYIIARKKARPGLTWYNLYRSLSLWTKLRQSKEDHDEFASATSASQEICNFEILSDGVIGILLRDSIVYYNIETLTVCPREPIHGSYSRYTENDEVIVILSYGLQLSVIRKPQLFGQEIITFDNVRLFLLQSHELFFVNIIDEIFVCDLNSEEGSANYLTKTDDGIMSLSYRDGTLNVLTFQREILSVINDDLVLRSALGPDCNLLDQLHRFNFLEYLDWRVYFQWTYVFNQPIPDGPLREIIIIRPYGDIYLIGSNWGVLLIYNAPYIDGEFDIFNTKPMKQYNFTEREDCPVLCICPILQIDVLEIHDGHTVLVGMPKKIAVLNFTHSFEELASMEMIPETVA